MLGAHGCPECAEMWFPTTEKPPARGVHGGAREGTESPARRPPAIPALLGRSSENPCTRCLRTAGRGALSVVGKVWFSKNVEKRRVPGSARVPGRIPKKTRKGQNPWWMKRGGFTWLRCSRGLQASAGDQSVNLAAWRRGGRAGGGHASVSSSALSPRTHRNCMATTPTSLSRLCTSLSSWLPGGGEAGAGELDPEWGVGGYGGLRGLRALDLMGVPFPPESLPQPPPAPGTHAQDGALA